MSSRAGLRVSCAAFSQRIAGKVPSLLRPALAVAAACVLANCTLDNAANLSAAMPRGASVAFDSIDGPPPGQFKKLVEDLNSEAQSRLLAVASRETPSAYRVRGYLAARQAKGQTVISWVWDVFDGDERRALRISGEETAGGRHRDAWGAADDAMLQRIARSSVDQLAGFLNAAETAPEPARTASIFSQDTSPEAAGIFPIARTEADPVAADSAAMAVPLPHRRPAAADTAVSAEHANAPAASRS